MAEAAEPETPQGDPPPETPPPVGDPEPPETPEPPEPQDDEGKPGGSDGQSVRARREYERRVAAEREREEARIETARLQERIKALEEQGKQPQQRVASMAEVNAMVEAGTITRRDADQYIEDHIIPARFDALFKKREADWQKQEPLKQANTEIKEYMNLIPSLEDKSSDDFKKVGKEYSDLIARGLPANAVTESMAVKLVFGGLDQVRKRSEVQRLSRQAPHMPTDGGGNGGGNGNGKIDVGKAPEDMQKIWDATGTPAKAREVEYKNYLAKQSARTAQQRTR